MTVLQTDRLILRTIQFSDFDELFRLNSDPIVMKYVGDGSTRSRVQMLSELDMLTSYYDKKPGLGIWAIVLKQGEQFVGAGGLTYNIDRAELEIGYRLLKEYWNNSYATEVSRGLLKYAFETLDASKVVGSAHTENIPSRKVMEKIGMKHVGTGFEFRFPQAYYEITSGDYFIPGVAR